jgi:hypothetical protein
VQQFVDLIAAALDALVAGIADNLRFHHAKSSQTKLRTYASFTYQAGSWTRPRKVVARRRCKPDTGGTTSTGMRQEVDIRYVVTSLKGSACLLYASFRPRLTATALASSLTLHLHQVGQRTFTSELLNMSSTP